MNCQYCNEPCVKIIPHQLENGLYENRIGRCNACQVDYFKSFYVLNCQLNGKPYSVSYSYDHPKHWTCVYQGSASIVLQFHQYVEFTPKNFQEKLKLYLLFS